MREQPSGGSWWSIAQRTVWSHRIVIPPPSLGKNFGLQQRIEDLPIQKLVSQFSVEGLDVAVFPWAARLDEQRLHTDPAQPLSDSDRCELRPIVRSNVIRTGLVLWNMGLTTLC